MRFDAVFFDFDGTLVQSARAKHDAFFASFPDTAAHRAVVARVLERDPNGSRHAVIPLMVEAMRGEGLYLPPGTSAEDRIAAYGAAALEAVARCPEMPGAAALLKALGGRVHRVICSVTPQAALDALILRRGWQRLAEEVHGFPAAKPETVARVLRQLQIGPSRAAVVGDGASDEEAARRNGCAFFRIACPDDFVPLAEALGVEHVRG